MGIYTAGLLICLIGQPQTYDTCVITRAPLAFPTEEQCFKSVAANLKVIPYKFNMELYEIVDIKCTNWLPEGDRISTQSNSLE